MALSQYQISYNGITIGAGTDVQLVGADGLRDLPPVRSSNSPRPRSHGVYAGLSYFGGRTITLQLLVMRTSSNDWETTLQLLAAAFQQETDPENLKLFQLQLPGWPYPVQIYARVTKYAEPVTLDYSHHKASVSIQLFCPEPMWLSPPKSQTVGLPSPTSGASFPWSFPLSFGSSSGGTLTVDNAGNTDAYPTFIITGPCNDPWIESNGARLTFGITLAASDYLTVDTDAHSVTLNGTASRNNSVQNGSQWFTCPKGSSTVAFGSANATQVAGTCKVTYADTFSNL